MIFVVLFEHMHYTSQYFEEEPAISIPGSLNFQGYLEQQKRMGAIRRLETWRELEFPNALKFSKS